MWDGACCVVVVVADIFRDGVERKGFGVRCGSEKLSIVVE